jgi:hypothetical protein
MSSLIYNFFFTKEDAEMSSDYMSAQASSRAELDIESNFSLELEQWLMSKIPAT